jgi:hypothetical protein
MQSNDKQPASWQQLLIDAITIPGTANAAYQAFHDYSIGNQMAALWQCRARGINPGPLCTFPGWLAKGRAVIKGQKAIVLCQPITIKEKEAKEPGEEPGVKRFFKWSPKWFALAQTEGEDFQHMATSPSWDRSTALATLKIEEKPFTMLDGNVQGYASGDSIAINPVAALPHKTTFHECAHIVLGHTKEHLAGQLSDSEMTPRTLREVEAESVAYILCETLNLPGSAESRNYIQHWLAQHGGQEIPEKSAQRIFKAADTILKAGQAKTEAVEVQ